MNNSRREDGFSLIELGIVVAVIAVLATVVIMGRGYTAAARVTKANELVNVTQRAITIYANAGNDGSAVGVTLATLRERQLLGTDTCAGEAGGHQICVDGVWGTISTYTVLIKCSPEAHNACQDVCLAAQSDPSYLSPSSCMPEPEIPLVFNL